MDRHKELHEENDRLRARLDTIVSAFIGCKWYDTGPLSWWKPEGEKYVTREALMAAIDNHIKVVKV